MVKKNIFAAVMIIISLYSLNVSANTGKDKKKMKKLVEFMTTSDRELNKLSSAVARASYGWSVNITQHNLKLKEKAGKMVSAYSKKMYESARKLQWKSLARRNATLYRWYEMVTSGLGIASAPVPYDQKYIRYEPSQKEITRSKDEKQNKEENPYSKMTEIFSKVKICPPGKSKGKCIASTDVSEIFAISRDPKELKHYWLEFRKQTGEKYKNLFVEAIKKDNNGVSKFGYKNQALYNIAKYEDKAFIQNVANEMKKLLPFYKQIHAYIRKKLKEHYKKENILNDGPIPAHLLGDQYAQKWSGISDIVKPYPKSSGVPNVTKTMLEKEMLPIDMFIMAERFFKSIGMKEMTPHFWHYSMIEKPEGRDVECHASAHTFSDRKDFRIKMCTTVDAETLEVVHHEMGHIEYFMYLGHLPFLFQDSPNPGFHEAIGDAISISVLTPSYLKQVGLLKNNETNIKNNESKINYLMAMALRYAVTVPYAYIIDFWRNQVYNGTIKESEFNKKYWEYRLQYQGVCPPEKRTEKHFDIGAKYHIASGVEYFRYYVANIMQFQIHKILCKEAGHKGPLHECNIYKNKKAGKAFAKFLSKGKSKKWQQLLNSFSRGMYKKLDASAILEYFKPLMDWLKKKNANEYKGWKSTDPMVCPGLKGSGKGKGSGVTGSGTKYTSASYKTRAGTRVRGLTKSLSSV